MAVQIASAIVNLRGICVLEVYPKNLFDGILTADVGDSLPVGEACALAHRVRRCDRSGFATFRIFRM
ncbi:MULTISPECIES: hypothetical protein [Aerosakkonema]|uniref:hypothetical protein n=1 Tax=Aerosakkonema TaxID=1246629 RepID=UPI0035B96C8B